MFILYQPNLRFRQHRSSIILYWEQKWINKHLCNKQMAILSYDFLFIWRYWSISSSMQAWDEPFLRTIWKTIKYIYTNLISPSLIATVCTATGKNKKTKQIWRRDRVCVFVCSRGVSLCMLLIARILPSIVYHAFVPSSKEMQHDGKERTHTLTTKKLNVNVS